MRTLVDQANEYQKQPRSNSSQAEVGLSYFWDHKEEPCHFVLLCIRFEGVSTIKRGWEREREIEPHK